VKAWCPKLLLFLLPLILSFASCARQDPDARLQAKLAGNWILISTPFYSNNNFHSEITIDPIGNYVVHASAMTVSNTVQTFEIAGNYRITDDRLINTVTNHSMLTNENYLPYFETNRIVRLTDNQLAVKFKAAYQTGEVIFRRELK
jgi:hypothetical protein